MTSSSPGADEKRLNHIRETMPLAVPYGPEPVDTFLLRLLDASQARLSEVERERDSNKRLCGYCKSWHSKPCGEGCYWSPQHDPTLAEVEKQQRPQSIQDEAYTEAMEEIANERARRQSAERIMGEQAVKCGAVEERASALALALLDARTAIERAPDETWGHTRNSVDDDEMWPVKDELLYNIDKALSQAAVTAGDD